jgi:hypothetical protein
MRKHQTTGFCLISGVLLATMLVLPACRGRSAEEVSSVRLEDRFAPAGAEPPENFQKQKMVTRKGQTRESLILTAPAVIQASLRGVSGRRTLRLVAAPVYDVGDGVLMTVSLKRGDARVPVESRYFDPARKARDRDWISMTIPLDVQPEDKLEIEITGGPQGDLTADWLALGSVQVSPR